MSINKQTKNGQNMFILLYLIINTNNNNLNNNISDYSIEFNDYKKQVTLFLAFICLLFIIFLLFQCFFEIDRFKQLYQLPGQVTCRLVMNKLLKALLIKLFISYKLKKFLKKSKQMHQIQIKLLRKILISRKFHFKQSLISLNKIYYTEVALNNEQVSSQLNNDRSQLINAKSISMLNWLCKRPHVFYGDMFTFSYDLIKPLEIPFVASYGPFKLNIFNFNYYKELYSIVDNEDLTIYLQTIYALSQTSLVILNCPRVCLLRKVFNCILKDWRLICDSIEQGIFLLPINLQANNIINLNSILMPNVMRANQLRSIFIAQQQTSQLDASKLWPNIEYISTDLTRTLNSNLIQIKEYFGKNIKLIPYAHMLFNNDEFILGHSIRDGHYDDSILLKEPVFTPVYDLNYYEFMDLETQNIYLLNEIEINKDYEMIISNETLQRYCTRQIVRFLTPYSLYQLPMYTYEYDLDSLLSIYNINLNEKLIRKKLNLISQLSKSLIVDYTTCIFDANLLRCPLQETSQDQLEFYEQLFSLDCQSCFILFIEFESLIKTQFSAKIKLGISNIFDEYISNTNKDYLQARKDYLLDKFKVYELKTGAFDACKQFFNNELKYQVPRKLTNYKHAQYLYNLRLDGKHFLSFSLSLSLSFFLSFFFF
jgi:hypothetical protein